VKVCCVIVTYGERAHFAEQTLRAAIGEGVHKVIVVDNGSEEQSARKLLELKGLFPGKVTVVSIPENSGSAGGFKAGLQKARSCDDCEMIWLLDDDNRPLTGALKALLDAFSGLPGADGPEVAAVAAFRQDRARFVSSVRGLSIDKNFRRRDSFLGFHLFDLPSAIMRRALRKRKKKEDDFRAGAAVRVIPYAPYGGLLFRKELLDKIGYPNEEFFVDQDDWEFTYRITSRKGKILLVLNSIIEDIDTSWHMCEEKGLYTVSYINEGNELRVFYGVRNKVFFEYGWLTDNKLIWNLNRIVYTNLLRCLALLYRRRKRFRLIKRAISEGRAGRLGACRDIPGPGKSQAVGEY